MYKFKSFVMAAPHEPWTNTKSYKQNKQILFLSITIYEAKMSLQTLWEIFWKWM